MRKIILYIFVLLAIFVAGCSNEQVPQDNNKNINKSSQNDKLTLKQERKMDIWSNNWTWKKMDWLNITDISRKNSKEIQINTWKLQSIRTESTWSIEKQQQYKNQIKNWSWWINTEKKAVDKARLYSNIGQPWKAIIVYNKYLNISWNKINYPITSNLWNLYEEICEIDWKINKNYCKNAITYFKIMINKYNKVRYYEDIIWVLLDMWQKNLAEEMYETYLDKWWRKNSSFEKRF